MSETIVLIWLIGACIAAYVGSDRKIGGGWVFLWSLILSPVVGLIIAFSSDKISDVKRQEEIAELQKTQLSNLESMRKQNEVSKTKELIEAKGLLDSGAISKEDYEVLKNKILEK
jgi:phosphate/sulfate permease